MLLNFDFDGVIVDSFEQIFDLAVLAQRSIGAGRAPTKSDLRTIENLTVYELGRRIGLSDKLASEYENEVFRLQETNWVVKIFPDIVRVFRELAKKNTLVVITSIHTDIASSTLKEFGLDKAISRVLGGELGLSKAERIEQSRKEFKSDFQNSFMVGDAISDVRQGKLAGVRTVAVTWGFQARELLEQESPDIVIDSPKDLLRIAT
jgi:phosphoglycolate phosphatase